jgi:hypothetical protein
MLDSYVDSDHCLPSLLYPADDGWRSNQEDENDDFQSSGHMRAPTMTTTVLRDSQSCSTLDSIDMNIDPVLHSGTNYASVCRDESECQCEGSET